MTIPSHYEINVAKKYADYDWKGDKNPQYRFYFRIEEIHSSFEDDAKELFKEIKDKYPEPEYNVTLHYVSCSSREIKVEGGEE